VASKMNADSKRATYEQTHVITKDITLTLQADIRMHDRPLRTNCVPCVHESS